MAKMPGTQLRQTWWFVGIVAALSTLLTNLVLRSAVLLVSPSSKLLDPPSRRG